MLYWIFHKTGKCRFLLLPTSCEVSLLMAHPPTYRRIARRPRPRMTPLRFLWRLFLAFVQIMLVVVLLLVAAAVWAYNYYGRDLPEPSAIGQHRPAETTRIYARDGQTLLYELLDPLGCRRTVVPFDRI